MSYNRSCLILAGLGGTMPTLCKLASIYVSNPDTDPPKVGLYIGLMLFFLIGSILAYAFSESDIKRAFIIGISAPGIITNIVAGASEANARHNALFKALPGTAYASEYQPPKLSVLAGTSEQKREISVEIFVKGSSNIHNMPCNFTIAAIGQRGDEQIVGAFSSDMSEGGDTKRMTFLLPIDSIAIKIYTKSITKRVVVPQQNFNSAAMAVIFHIEHGNDFLWALGGKREVHVVDIESYFTRFD